MNTDRQRFFNNLSTGSTDLRSSVWVDFLVSSPSIFSFRSEYGKEDSPSSVGDTFCKVAILNHVSDFEFFNNDMIVKLNDREGDLVTEIKALIRYFFMTLGNQATCFSSSVRTPLPSGKALLSFLQSLLRRTKELRGLNLLSITGRQKSVETHIDTDSVTRHRKEFGFTLNEERSIPFGISSRDADRFGFTFNRPVPLHLDATHVLEIEPTFLNLAAISNCGITDRIEPLKRFESGVTGILFGLNSTKERLERLVQSAKCLLKRAVIAGIKKVTLLSNLRQKRSGLARISDALSRSFVSFFSLAKGLIVENAVAFKLILKGGHLLAGRIKTVSEGSQHLLPLLTLNILANCRGRNASNAGSKITSAPQSREATPKRGKFLPQYSACITLQPVNDFSNASDRFVFNEKMNMIWHNIKSMNNQIQFFGLLSKKLFKSSRNFFLKYGAAVFWAPNKMYFDAENRPSIFSISAHDTYYTTADYIMQVFCLERRGGLSSAT